MEISSYASCYWEFVDKEDANKELEKLLSHALETLSAFPSNDELVTFYQPEAYYHDDAFLPKHRPGF